MFHHVDVIGGSRENRCKFVQRAMSNLVYVWINTNCDVRCSVTASRKKRRDSFLTSKSVLALVSLSLENKTNHRTLISIIPWLKNNYLSTDVILYREEKIQCSFM
jgi:hypothetical protein